MKKNFKNRVYTSLFLLIMVYLIFTLKIFLVYSLIVLGVIALLEFHNLINKIFKRNIFIFFFNFFFITYMFFFCFLFLVFSDLIHLKILILIILLGCISSDIGGYVIGNFLKGPKLTKISPNKTISGAIGSIVFTYLTIMSLTFYYTNINRLILSIEFHSMPNWKNFSYIRKAKLKIQVIFYQVMVEFDRLDSILFGFATDLQTQINSILGSTVFLH